MNTTGKTGKQRVAQATRIIDRLMERHGRLEDQHRKIQNQMNRIYKKAQRIRDRYPPFWGPPA